MIFIPLQILFHLFYCKNNYNLRKQLWSLTFFTKRFIVDGSGVLNMPWVRNMYNALFLYTPEFWIYQGSEYTSSSEYTRALMMPLVLNMPGFWICQVSKYTRVLNMPGLHHGDNPWLHRVRNIPEYFLNMPEYAWICIST